MLRGSIDPVAASSALVIDESGDRPSVSATRGHVDTLTGLRGFAALVVLVVHVSGRTDYPWIGIHGYGPVSLFVLSGFLLYQPWSRWALAVSDRPAVGTFARRRLARIFPAYLVTLLVVAVVLPASQPLGVDGWLRALTLTNTTSPTGLRPGMEHVWSLGTELSWYLLLPVVGLLAGLLARRAAPRHRTAVVVGVFALSLPVTALWRWALEIQDLNSRFTWSFWLPGFLVCFLGGAAVAHVLQARHAGLSRARSLQWLGRDHPWVLLGVAVVVGGVGASSLGGPWDYVPATFTERHVRFASVTALALLLLVGAAVGGSRSPLTRVFSVRWMVAVGRWSYGVYLWHLPVIELLDPVVPRSGPGGWLLLLTLTLSIAVPLGAATFAWVEQPAIRWSRQSREERAARRRSPAAGDRAPEVGSPTVVGEPRQ